MVLLADVSKRRVVVLRLAVKQFKQALFVLSDRSQIADITKQMKKCCEAMKQLAPQKTLDVPFGDPLDEIEYEDHIFNPAKLVHRKSQTHRRISNCLAVGISVGTP